MSDMILSRWTPEGVRDAMDEGERGIDTDRWGAGIGFRIQAIACAVATYDARFENNGGDMDAVLDIAADDAMQRLADIGLENMSRLVCRQLCRDMYEAVGTVLAQDMAEALTERTEAQA